MSELANTCASRGWSVRLVTVAGTHTDFYSLRTDINRVALNNTGESGNFLAAFARNWERIRRLRWAVTTFNPDAVLVFGARTNILALLALTGINIPVVVSERTDPFALNIGFPWHHLRPWIYRRAAKVVAQTERVAEKIKETWNLPNLEVIPNPLPNELPKFSEFDCDREKLLISVGRLSREKGHDILLDAWALVKDEFPDWRLRLVGDGPERNRLESQALRLGLGNCMEFVGQTQSVWTEYISARVFVLPSRREGFPNALLEALACGCICVASDCNSGPAEILKNGEFGVLYEPNSAENLAGALRNALRQTVGAASLDFAKKVRNQYRISTIMDQWSNVLTKVDQT